MDINKIVCGDCLDVLKEVEDESVDCLVCDPPYGYNFMGKDWDKVVPKVEIWKECLRVMKAGGFAFVMSAPRQDVLSHMIFNLEKAGFDTGFTSIYWTYASGFPKAMNISKAVDKRLGEERQIIGKKQFKATNGGEAYGSFAIGQQDITEATSDEAKELDGSYGGFQPKPAVEIIIVAMKPLSEKTFIDQALKNKKGITWLDDCRVPFVSDNDKDSATYGGYLGEHIDHTEGKFGMKGSKNIVANDSGRFPANLLVSDDVLNDGQVYESAGGEANKEKGANNVYEFNHGNIYKSGEHYEDSGSFSRYFDLDKWWEERIKSLPENVRKVFPFLIEPKAAKSEKNNGLEGMEEQRHDYRPNDDETQNTLRTRLHGSRKKVNHHPTVKPIKLMSYLIALGSREGDVILDPFIGSGTTALAAKSLSRNFIGIEISEEYHKIAEARLKLLNQQPTLF